MLSAKSHRRVQTGDLDSSVASADLPAISARSSSQVVGTLLHSCRRFIHANAVILLPALVFFVLIIAVNWQLFVTPLIESGDAAANAIQVQNAKHLHELLGNYSRWHFHHPGPFFFYLFALGESLCYNFLHLVPAPLNGEYLAQLLFNVVCLFAAIYVFHVNVKRPLLPAIGTLISVLFLYVVYTAIPYSAINPIWPPYMAMFCFLLLASSVASVAAGNWKHLPMLALSAMIMIHAHVAQLLFASILAAAGVLTAAFQEFRAGNLARALRREKYYLGAAAVIVSVFLLPIALDWAVRHPNNIHQIRAYLREHRGEHNSVSATLLYVGSFFVFDRTPEIALATPAASVKDIIHPEFFVSVYWSIFLFAALFTFIWYFGRFRQISLFLRFVFAEAALITILFVYWSWRITGPMFNFNGFFFFSVQLFVLLGLGSLICNLIGRALQRRAQIALACASASPLLLLSGVTNGYPTDPDVLPVVSLIRAERVKQAAINMQPETWPTAAGVASYLDRSGISFCVEPSWGFTFGAANTCTSTSERSQLSFTEGRPDCKTPCSIIYNRDKLYVTLVPPAEQHHRPGQ